MYMNILKNKIILITGIISKRSIAYNIAQIMSSLGAKLVFTYPKNQFNRIIKLVKDFNPIDVIPCDVSDDDEINNLPEVLKTKIDKLDGFVHSIAYAPNDQISGDFLSNITREGFRISHDISTYSLCALSKVLAPLMSNNSSIVTLSYLGAEKYVCNYNTMGLAKASLESAVRYIANSIGKNGIRCNAVSAGPLLTIASSAIKNFKNMLNYHSNISPLRRNITVDEVTNVVIFLISTLSSGITGEIIHVDGGFSTVSVSSNYNEL